MMSHKNLLQIITLLNSHSVSTRWWKAVCLNNDITIVLTNNLTKFQTENHEPLKQGLKAIKWSSDEYKVVTEICFMN